MTLYYQDDSVTLYHGDSSEITEWLKGDVLVTDPPYGRSWKSGAGLKNSHGRGRGSPRDGGIAGDDSTMVRDAALTAWGNRPGVVFGDLLIPQPARAVQVLIYAKPADAGIRGAHAGRRRDAEAIYLTGQWPVGIGGSTSILRTNGLVAGPTGSATRYRHPHAKPLDLMQELIAMCPPGIIVDPFTGSGATLVAARLAGRKAIGVELEERHCEMTARRLSQGVMTFEDPRERAKAAQTTYTPPPPQIDGQAAFQFHEETS